MEGKDFFGLQSTSSMIDEATANFLMDGGGGIGGDPTTISKIEEDGTKKKKQIDPKKEEVEEPEIIEDVSITEDDIFGEDPDKTTTKAPEDKTTTSKQDDSVEDVINYQALVNGLVSLGVLNELGEDEEITTEEQFAMKFQADALKKANQEIYNILTERHGEKGIEAFDAIYVNGMSPAEYFGKQSAIENLKEIDLSIEANQQRVIEELYRRQGFSEDKIARKIEKLKDYGDLEEESTLSHELLIQQDEERFSQEVERKSQEAKAIQLQRQTYLQSLQTIMSEKLKTREFDGIPVTEKVANETLDYLYTEKWKLPTGEKLTDFDRDILELKKPEKHSLKIKLALLLRNDLDLTKLKTPSKAISNDTKKLFDGLAVKDKTIKRQTINTNKSFFDI